MTSRMIDLPLLLTFDMLSAIINEIHDIQACVERSTHALDDTAATYSLHNNRNSQGRKINHAFVNKGCVQLMREP